MSPTPITILTGFLGAGKTTLILNLISQLPASYRLALLKNEFGDVAVDSKLATQQAISDTRELLNGCICCNLVGQLGDALFELRGDSSSKKANVNRIVIETSGSAFPATLAMEVNRLINENPGTFVLDGVISVIDVENWTGYDDTSPTARMQARYTDLIVFNKWEVAGERRFDDCLDRVGDLEVSTPWVKSDKGWVDKDVILGLDGALIAQDSSGAALQSMKNQDAGGGGGNHQNEVDVLSVILKVGSNTVQSVNLDQFEQLLLMAPKDEVYRIKGLVASTQPPPDSKGERGVLHGEGRAGRVEIYVLNWAFGRWTYTVLSSSSVSSSSSSPKTDTDTDTENGNGNDNTHAMDGASARLTFILARGEANKWKKKLEQGKFIAFLDSSSSSKGHAELTVRQIDTAKHDHDHHDH